MDSILYALFLLDFKKKRIKKFYFFTTPFLNEIIASAVLIKHHTDQTVQHPVKRLYKFTDRNREKRDEELNKKRMSDYI